MKPATLRAPEVAVRAVAPRIGTLREGDLHADLKRWYARPGDRLEVPVGGYVVDLVRDGCLVEFQTGSFSPLRRKVRELLAAHRVHVVAPIVVGRFIQRVADTGEIRSRRRSPKRGRLEDVFERLVSIPELLAHPAFTLEAVLVDIDEIRVQGAARAFRRRGWTVYGRALRCVHAVHPLATVGDAAALLPTALPDAFGTEDLARCAGVTRRLAQQMLYCLTAMGATQRVGKRGNAIVYRRAVDANAVDANAVDGFVPAW